MGLTRPRAAQIFNIDYKQAVRAVTVGNIAVSGGAPNLVDGVNLSVNDRILVTGQDTHSDNGLYYVRTVGTGSNGTWTSTTDANDTGEVEAGMIVMVTEGTTYADTQWKLTTDNPIFIGITGLTFVQNYSTNSISAGTSNVIVGTGANIRIDVAGTSNVAVFATTGEYVTGVVSATGNITGNYFIGNGSQLTGMYGNANVATYLPTYSGNLSPGNISSVAGTITGVVIPKANTVTDGTSISINTDLADLFIQTNTQTAGTLTINAPSGTPVNGQKFMIRLSSTAIQTFSWNAIYAGSTDLPLPGTSSGSGKYDYLGFIYNSTATKWQLLAKTFGF